MMWSVAFQMAKSNLLILLRDRKALLLTVLMPILLTAILSFALSSMFGGKGLSPFHVIVYNGDAGKQGTVLEKVIRDVNVISVITAATKDDANQAVQQGTADVAVMIPADYSAKMDSGKTVNVTVESTLSHSTDQSLVQSVVNSFGRQSGLISYGMQQRGSHGEPLRMPQAYVNATSPGLHPLTSGSYYAIGMLTLFMMTNIMIRASSLVRERANDTTKRILASPASRGSIMFGYWFSTFVQSCAQAALLLLANRFLLGIHLNSVGQVALLFVAYAAALSSVALAVGMLFNNPTIVDAVGGVGVQIIAVLGGSMMPLTVFPPFLQKVARALPNGAVLRDALNSVMGTRTADLLPTVAYLLVLALVFALIARTRFGKMLQEQ